MIIDTEKNQMFLELIYYLQINKSNAVLSPKGSADKLLNRQVYRAYDNVKNKWFFSLQPIKNIERGTEKINKVGGRPRTLSDEQIKEIKLFWASAEKSDKNKSALARKYNVSEKVIRNILKQ